MKKCGLALILLLELNSIAHAQNCSELAEQGSEAQLQLSTALDEYKALAQQIEADRIVVGAARILVPASFKVLEASDSYADAIRRADEAGCFGGKASEWTSTLHQLNQDRRDFATQHWGLVHRAFLEAAFACIIRAKRDNLALPNKPSPEEFSSIVREKCSKQARAMDAAVNTIEDLPAELKAEVNKHFESAVLRAVQEYSSAIGGPASGPASKSSLGTK